MSQKMSSQNCSFPWKDPGLQLTHGSLGPPEYTSQTTSQLVQPF